MLNSVTGWPNTLLTEETVMAATALALVESFIFATGAVLGRGRAEQLAVHMANRLAEGCTDPEASEDEQLANRLAAEEFRLRVLPMLVTPP